MSKLVLASQSVQRAELLATVISDFVVMPADIDELAIDDPNHEVRAKLVAEAKARAVVSQHNDEWILAADTFVLFENKRWEKPQDLEEAAQMLATFAGNEISVLTGVCLQKNTTFESNTVVSQVRFRDLSSAEIEHYISGKPVTAWAGGFSIKETAGLSLISSITGSVTAVAGLPLEWVKPKLIAAGLIGKNQ